MPRSTPSKHLSGGNSKPLYEVQDTKRQLGRVMGLNRHGCSLVPTTSCMHGLIKLLDSIYITTKWNLINLLRARCAPKGQRSRAAMPSLLLMQTSVLCSPFRECTELHLKISRVFFLLWGNLCQNFTPLRAGKHLISSLNLSLASLCSFILGLTVL